MHAADSHVHARTLACAQSTSIEPLAAFVDADKHMQKQMSMCAIHQHEPLATFAGADEHMQKQLSMCTIHQH